MSTIQDSWQHIQAITQSLEQSVNQEDWTTTAEIARERHIEITQHFQRFPVGPDTAHFYHQHLSSFINQEDAFQTIVTKARKESMKNNLQLVQNRKAVNAYNSDPF